MSKQPVKALQVIGQMNRGGAETLLMHILRHMDPTRIQIDFLVHTLEPGAYDEEIRATGARIIYSPYTHQPISYAANFLRALRDYGPYDVVHSHVHHYTGFVLWLSWLAGVPSRIAHSHADTSLLDSRSGMLRRAYLKMQSVSISRYATAGLAAGSRSAEALFGPKWTTDGRWRMYSHGIDTSPFGEPVDSVSTRAGLGIPEDAFVLGHVGRFDPQKNHTFLLKIAAELVKRRPSAVLLLLGDGPLRSEIKSEAADLNIAERVIFAGVRSDVPQLMMGAIDVFCLPSIYEGLPVVLLEAQAAGLPMMISGVVTSEADVVDGLVQRLSTDCAASEWAEAILDHWEQGPKVSREAALAALEASPYNITNSIRVLEDIYLGISSS